MNFVLFAKMDQVFSYKNKTLKKILENGKKYWKSRELCQFGKVGTMLLSHFLVTRRIIPWKCGFCVHFRIFFYG